MGSNLGLCQANGSALVDCVENNEKAVRKPMSIEQPPLHHNALVQPWFSPPIGFISFITWLLFIIFHYEERGGEETREKERWRRVKTCSDVLQLVSYGVGADRFKRSCRPSCVLSGTKVVFILDGLTRLTFMISDDIVWDYGNLSFIVVKLIGCR